MNMNFKSLLLGTSLSLIPTITNAQCIATTDCATLGYTEKSCPDGKGIRCPFGTTYACPMSETKFCDKYGFNYECKGTGYASGIGQACNNKYISCTCAEGYEWNGSTCDSPAIKVTIGSCTGAAENCKIGWLLNSDGTCTSGKVNNKIPIAVIVYIGIDGCGQALALETQGIHLWAQKIPLNVGELPDHKEATALLDFDSCQNTNHLVNWGDDLTIGRVVRGYSPSFAPETKGKWCLPAGGVGRDIYKYKDRINPVLREIGATEIDSSIYWTSTEYNMNFAWWWNYSSGEFDYSSKIANTIYVRPVIEF